MSRTPFIKRLRAATRYILGYYEGARWHSGRSYIQSALEDARKDITASTRREITRKSRYFEQNDWLANALGLAFEQYTVGFDGLNVSPASSSPEFNLAAAEYWDATQKILDIETGQGFGHFQGKSVWRWFFDGEFYWLKTKGSSGFARLQGIEAHKIKTPDALKDRKDIVDGVRIDEATGRPLVYYISDKPVDASLVIPILERSRSMQSRALPFLTPVINKLHDAGDLDALEMANAKAHSEHATFIENETGEADVEDLIREGQSVTNGDSTIGQDTEVRAKYYREALGGRVAYGKHGDKVHSISNANPSAAQQWYHDTTISKICAAVGISKQLVMPLSLQGTTVRADLDRQAQRFRSWSSVMIGATQDAYGYVMGAARANPRAMKHFRGIKWPDDFRKSHVRPPRGVNVDVGRNSAAALAQLKAGGMTFQQWYSELGLDWRNELTQKATEAEFINQLAQDAGVSPQLISDIMVSAATQPTKEPATA